MCEVIEFPVADMSGPAIRVLMPHMIRLKTLAAKAVLMKLAMSHIEGQIVQISVHQLARDIDVKRDTIYRAVEEIEAAGIATRRPSGRDFILWVSVPHGGTVPLGDSPATGPVGVPSRDSKQSRHGTPSNTKNPKEGVVPLFSVDKSR